MSQQLNLFNPLFLRQKKYFSARTMARGLGIVVLAFIALNVFQRIQLAGQENQRAEAASRLEISRQQLVQVASDAQRSPSKVLEDSENRMQTQIKAQQVLLEGLESGALGSVEGFSQYMVALARQSLPGVWLTGFSATGAEGPQMIRGRLLRPELLPNYLRMLNREPALRGQGFAHLQLTTREEKEGKDSGASFVEFTLGEQQMLVGQRAEAPRDAQSERDAMILEKMRMALRGGQ